MSLELFELKRSRPGKLLLDINDEQYQDLVEVFESYRSKTGIIIDKYTDTKLSLGLTVLIESVREVIKLAKSNSQIRIDLLHILEIAKLENQNVVFLGGGYC